MKRHIIGVLAILLVAAACTPRAEPTTTSTTGAPPPTLPASVELAITEVTFGNDAAVTLTNYSADSIDLEGVWLGQGSAFVQFASSVIGAGESLVVGTSESPDLDTGVATGGYVGIGNALGSLEPAGGEAALFRHGAFDDPGALISYVQWGSATGRHAEVAGTAGLWDPPAFVRTGSEVSRISASEIRATSAAEWSSR